jgi:uncharacterized protein (TIGR02611 family)
MTPLESRAGAPGRRSTSSKRIFVRLDRLGSETSRDRREVSARRSSFRRAVDAGKKRFSGLRSRVRSLPGGHHLWRIGVALVGLAVVVAGAIMLVVPGPGWAVIFLGVGIWATEFPWARALLQVARRWVARMTSWLRGRPLWLWIVIGLACVLLAAVVVVLVVV